MFKPDDKVYFHRGPVELVGVVEAVAHDTLTLLGVEMGFASPQRQRITVTELDYLCAMDDDTFARLVRDEPAFATLCGDARSKTDTAALRQLAAAA